MANDGTTKAQLDDYSAIFANELAVCCLRRVVAVVNLMINECDYLTNNNPTKEDNAHHIHLTQTRFQKKTDDLLFFRI